jgi:2-polyprenyl-3-methyl-5-hydroxy-6-metoxy-1,4-benzoquinol methylase
MSSIIDEKGFNQSFIITDASIVRLKRRFDFMISHMELNNNSSKINVLEIGCAEGEGLRYLVEKTGFNGIGIDISNKFISNAKKNNDTKATFEVVDFNNKKTFTGEMGYNKFDYIVGNGILHHLYYNLDNSLKNLHKLLKPGGKIIFIEPNLYNPYVFSIFKIPFLRKIANLEPDEMAFTNQFIKDKILKVGFKNCETEIKDFLLPNTPKPFIKSLIKLGTILEKTPLTIIAQSIFIVAEKQD